MNMVAESELQDGRRNLEARLVGSDKCDVEQEAWGAIDHRLAEEPHGAGEAVPGRDDLGDDECSHIAEAQVLGKDFNC